MLLRIKPDLLVNGCNCFAMSLLSSSSKIQSLSLVMEGGEGTRLWRRGALSWSAYQEMKITMLVNSGVIDNNTSIPGV